jgi:DNA-binding MarR family transcriptional regulator
MITSPSQSIFYTIEKAIKEYRRYAQAKINQDKLDITIDQAIILFFLNDNRSLSQNEIAKLVFKDKASITRMIELMKRKNYINRSINYNDRRKYSIELTSKGKEAIHLVRPIISLNRKNALNGIPLKEINQLEKTLNSIIKNCNPT